MSSLKWSIAVWIMLVAVAASGQSLIGQPKEEVSRRISMYHKEFSKDNMVVSQHFNYLKYVNGMRTRTWILYFDEENICHLSKMVCDYSEYNAVLEELNAGYRKTGDSSWEYSRGNQVNDITLSRQEYYFTVREERRDRSETM